MRKRNTESVGDILQQVLYMNRMDGKLNEVRLIASWKTVLGEYINNYTQDLQIRNKVLIVKLTSAALRSELFMNRQLLCQKLNNAVGTEVIKDIKFL